jgi:hypothetical protein
MDDYINLLPEFVLEVLDAYENWDGKDNVPPKNPRTHNESSKSKPHTEASNT